MVVRLLFFGTTADLAGKREVEVNVEGPMTARELLQRGAPDCPGLHERKLLFGINQEYADGDTILKEGDELAVFTAVSGG